MINCLKIIVNFFNGARFYNVTPMIKYVYKLKDPHMLSMYTDSIWILGQ